MKKFLKSGIRIVTFLVALTVYQLQSTAQTVSLSLQPGSCGKDALIGSCAPCGQNLTNYGNSPEFNAMSWTNVAAIANQRSLIQFDLSAIPVGSVVSSAAISFYFDINSSNGQHSSQSGPNDANLLQITSPWEENIVIWNNQPTTTTTNAIYLPPSTSPTQDYLNLDATAMIQSFVNNPATNYGMMLKMVTEIQYRRLVFASSDHPNAALRPRLVVNYTPSGQAPLLITPVGTTTICPGATAVTLNVNSMSGATYQWYKNGVAVAGATSTSYVASSVGSYTVTAAVGCGLVYTSASVQINSYSVPVISGLNSSYYCVSPSVVLSGQPSGGTFSGPGISGNTFSPSTAGTGGPYNIVYSVTSNGCLVTATQATSVSTGYNCAVPQNVNLTNITGTTAKVNWSNASGSQMQVRYRKLGTNANTIKSFSSTACNTSYTITGLKKNTTYLVSVRTNCASGASAYSPEITLTTANARFAEEPITSNEVTMFPSPAINLLNLDISVSENQSGVLHIFDLAGREVLNQPLVCSPGENSFSVDISHLKAGNYMVIAEGTEISFRQIMIKQ